MCYKGKQKGGRSRCFPRLRQLSRKTSSGFVGRFAFAGFLRHAFRFEPGCRFRFLRGFGSGLFVGIAFGAQFFDQLFPIARTLDLDGQRFVFFFADRQVFRGLGNDSVEFTL